MKSQVEGCRRCRPLEGLLLLVYFLGSSCAFTGFPLAARKPVAFDRQLQTALFVQEKQRAVAQPKIVSVKNFRRPRSIALVPLEVDESVDQRHNVDFSVETDMENVVESVVESTQQPVDQSFATEAKDLHVHNNALQAAIEVLPEESSNIVADSLETIVGSTTMVSDEIPTSGNVDSLGMASEQALVSTPSQEQSRQTDKDNASSSSPNWVDASTAYFAQPMKSGSVEVLTTNKALSLSQAVAPSENQENDSNESVRDTIHVEQEAASETASARNVEDVFLPDTVGNEHSMASAAAEPNTIEQNFFPTPPETDPPSALLPKREWEANIVCGQAFEAVDQHPILLFDGACNLCNGWVNFCLDFDSQAKFRFASLQSKVGQSILIRDGRSPDDRSDIILATSQETFAKSDALLSVVSELEGLPFFFRVSATAARIALPPWLRDAAYKFISAHRHILGDTDGPVCRLDLDGEYTTRFIEDPELEEEPVSAKRESAFSSWW